MRFKFSELKKTKRGEPVSSEVNKVARDAVEKLGDADLLKLFDDAEKNRWYGDLVYPLDNLRTFEVKFRHGICQFLKVIINQGKAFFKMNIINNNVDFREDGHNE